MKHVWLEGATAHFQRFLITPLRLQSQDQEGLAGIIISCPFILLGLPEMGNEAAIGLLSCHDATVKLLVFLGKLLSQSAGT